MATVNDAAINTGVQVSFQDSVLVSFGYVPRSGIAGSYGSFTFNFSRTSILFSIIAVPTPTTVYKGSLFPTFSQCLLPVVFFWWPF